MPTFLGVHKLSAEMTDSEITEGFNSYKESALKRGLKPIRAHYNLQKAVAYCETEANSAQDVELAHKDADIPIEDVIEIKTLT